MQIIEERRLEQKAECLRCHSIFIVSRRDLRLTIFDNVYLHCPICGSKSYLSDEQRALFKI